MLAVVLVYTVRLCISLHVLSKQLPMSLALKFILAHIKTELVD